MKPEKRFNQQVWEILQDIKERLLATEVDKPVEYKIGHVVGVGIIPRERRVAILRKLQEWGALKIATQNSESERYGLEFQWENATYFVLKINRKKFDEVYEKYKKACDLTSYLNDYQEKMVKGEDPPDFLHLESTNDKGTQAKEKHKGQMFETGGGGGYYNRSHPPRSEKKQSANEIVDGFSSSNYAFVLMVVEGILSASEFGSGGEVNYRLQSAPGQNLMQERQLLSKFEELGLFRHLGEDGIYGIATLKDVDTKTIGQIATEIKSRQLNLQTEPEGKSADLKARYDQLVEKIRGPKQTSSGLSNLEERYQKTINEIKGRGKSLLVPHQTDTQVETDFTDTASRRGQEIKWDVLQAIWDVYESHSRPDSILVPVARLTIKGRSVESIDGIINGLKKESLFQNWDRQDRWYNLEFINHEKLPETYKEIREIYKKFATAYQERNKNDTSVKNQSNQIVVSFDDKKPAVIVNEKEVKIPYGTNQYNLCKAVFGTTKKRWENDELLDKFGANIEDVKVKRQPYDAMLAVNKKVKQESGINNLILCENKTFRLNPKYLT